MAHSTKSRFLRSLEKCKMSKTASLTPRRTLSFSPVRGCGMLILFEETKLCNKELRETLWLNPQSRVCWPGQIWGKLRELCRHLVHWLLGLLLLAVCLEDNHKYFFYGPPICRGRVGGNRVSFSSGTAWHILLSREEEQRGEVSNHWNNKSQKHLNWYFCFTD